MVSTSFLHSLDPNISEEILNLFEDYNCLEKLIRKHSSRLGVDYFNAYTNMLRFAKIVGQAENSGKLTGKNRESSAEGLYQFINASILPALNRLSRTTGWLPWMVQLKDRKISISDLSWSRQTLMFFAQMLEMKGSDKYMTGVLLDGNNKDMTDAYMILHHTNPDQATIRNWNRALDIVG